MQIEQSEVYDKVRGAKVSMFYTTPGVAPSLSLFGGFTAPL